VTAAAHLRQPQANVAQQRRARVLQLMRVRFDEHAFTLRAQPLVAIVCAQRPMQLLAARTGCSTPSRLARASA
jgi:hypothetical protein